MAAVLAPGQTYEVEAVAPMLSSLKNILLIGDKGFDSDDLRQQLLAQGCLASFHRDRGDFHQLGIIGDFIANGTKSKISSNESKFTSVFPLVMKNWL